MITEILGGGPIDGQLGENPDWGSISCPSGRILQSVLTNGDVQFWLTSNTQETGGQQLGSLNYANPRGISGNPIDNANVIKSILISMGLSGNHGYFVVGFDYTVVGDVGVANDGTLWEYVGPDPLPVTVAPGTVPSAPDYELVRLNDHSRDINRNAVGAHDDIYVRTVTSAKAIAEDAPVGTRYLINEGRYDVVESTDTGGFYIDGLASGRRLKLVFSDTVHLDWIGAGGGGDDSAALNLFGSLDGITVTGNSGKTYSIGSKVNVTANNTVIDFNNANVNYTGAGADNIFNAALNIQGELSATSTTCTADIVEKTSEITVASTAGLGVGDVVEIDADTTVVMPDIYLLHCFEIVEIVGNVLKLDSEFGISASSALGITVTKVNAVKNSHIKNIGMFTADNQTSRANGVSACMGTYTTNCTIDNVESEGIWFKNAIFQHSHEAQIIKPKLVDPAGTSGGEGYCSQLSYCTLSNIVAPKGINCRHTTDVTASWNYKVYGGVDRNSVSGGFINHSAYERFGDYIACVSHSPQNQGFAMGATLGFGQNAGDLTLTSCHVRNAKGGNSALTYTAKDLSGLSCIGCTFEMSLLTGTQAVTTSMSNASFTECKLLGGIQLTSGGDIKSDGYAKLNNCDVTKGGGRAINLTPNMELTVSGGTIEGLATLAANTELKLIGCDWTRTSNKFWETPNATHDNQKVVVTSGSKLLQGDGITSDCTFIAGTFEISDESSYITSSGVTYFYTLNTRLKGAGDIVGRMVFGNLTNQTIDVVNSDLGSYSANPVMYLFNYNGKVKITNSNIANSAGSTGDAITLDSNSQLTDIKMLACDITGDVVIQDADVDKCYIVGNTIDASTTLLPTPAVNKIVESNY